MELAKVVPIALPPGRRVIVISDIHGNLAFLKGLLAQVGFDRSDILILLGDLLEKGEDSLAALRYVMELGQAHEVHMVCGNCDNLAYNFVDQLSDIPESFYISYIGGWGKKCVLRQMADEIGLPLRGVEDYPALRAALPRRFRRELDYLRALPTALTSEKYLFVHGGIPGAGGEEDMTTLPAWPCMKCDDFLGMGKSFSKWVVVGHWPVTLYNPKIPSAAPLILPERHIISIDGGCQLKWDGQLNALILPDGQSEDFTWQSYDGLPSAAALDPQSPNEDSINIRWSENPVEILQPGPEFSRCRHIASGRVLDILTQYLYEKGGVTRCEDSTDYLLPVSPGDVLSIVRATSRGYLAKKDGVTGWYLGRLAL
ncbi:serine/threonine protein phosphatase [Pseudoflavonifractor sp. 524-17]|uniref:metallophosphoesterase n=1 Tax=Pseudoflavonifractor sp. 524-17 TaxID=2304577 RepID=UPI00137B606C|nr:metallophosphoesterase [Pseudoflavonifractor sp. 524-17]NCE66218.1 serine/threonine protein phosphatase [Pseudoflavonifractor sp. 524-17]